MSIAACTILLMVIFGYIALIINSNINKLRKDLLDKIEQLEQKIVNDSTTPDPTNKF